MSDDLDEAVGAILFDIVDEMSRPLRPAGSAHLADCPGRNVTVGTDGERRPQSDAERMRKSRLARRAPGDLVYRRPDWHDLLDLGTLPRRGGCQPDQLAAVVLREVADNALDAGGTVTIDALGPDKWAIADTGPGIDPDAVVDLFSVSRPLSSSKLKRLPTRGALGNGLRVVMGAVAASGGSLTVATRGHLLVLDVETRAGNSYGKTFIVSDDQIPHAPGTRITITFGRALRTADADARLAETAIRIAQHGSV